MDMNLGVILGENMGQSSVPRSHRDSRFDIWSGEKLQAATPEKAYTRRVMINPGSVSQVSLAGHPNF
ncbi:hypothetical protein FRACYDRAFT_271484 [Fragilariopsis cylindrus CCMP1102]|uniref:Uncharacterized protein n=1 Tax=Fragilariopsis cylindrus CCMP1102 TaxID=635003 RepID=A0A1E7ETL3_9STRA|nr:hypothetical protein FRACYDRAFT_271484 [Fragilariopsis cylindrus CCMP1102]|eukprot:OEU09311.1 hypothetical protein FRACYDRAFT_271484 [Fragilariopsis cylindrus CCMP1102]